MRSARFRLSISLDGFISFIAIGWPLCSGALLNRRYLLTAASCASQESNFNYITLLLGDFDLKNKCNESDHCLQKQTFSIEEAIPHPLYNGTFNDIGLIRLNESVVYTEYIRPICLPKNIRSFEMGDTLFTSGFVVHFDPTIQKDRFKRNTTTILKPNNVCTKWHIENGHVITMTEFNFCASDSEESQFPNTFMDLGGPAVSLYNNQWYVEGVLSMALDTADRSRPTVYTNVTYYIDWIESNMKPWN
ncbi:hypothetical protein RI129_007621 [Pyrocoelia pectoralis]|uniref:Peptidase S1 domain-containing protein n=1 Tax=Pyrocoelia pectoralis TaxID=417401 RepID=A0AAN7ZMX7_9COLE